MRSWECSHRVHRYHQQSDWVCLCKYMFVCENISLCLYVGSVSRCVRLCLKRQVVDLVAEGYTPDDLDAQPAVSVEDWWDIHTDMHILFRTAISAQLTPARNMCVFVCVYVGTVGGQTVGAPTSWQCGCWMRMRKFFRNLNQNQSPWTQIVMTAPGNGYCGKAQNSIIWSLLVTSISHFCLISRWTTLSLITVLACASSRLNMEDRTPSTGTAGLEFESLGALLL